MVRTPTPRLRSGEVSVGVGVFESVATIRRFRGWAWVGLLIRNPTEVDLFLGSDSIRVETIPRLPKVLLFLFGPYDDGEVSELWEEVDAGLMHRNLISSGNPFPDRTPRRELVLSAGQKAILWIYLKDEQLDAVTVVVSLLVGAREARKH